MPDPDLSALFARVIGERDLATCPILADRLEDLGRPREAVLLRRRWQRWVTKRHNDLADIERRSAEGAFTLMRAGEAYARGYRDGRNLARQDDLLAAYVARLRAAVE